MAKRMWFCFVIILCASLLLMGAPSAARVSVTAQMSSTTLPFVPRRRTLIWEDKGPTLGRSLATSEIPPATPSIPSDKEWIAFVEPAFGYAIEYPNNWVVRLVADNTRRPEGSSQQVAQRSIGFFGPGSSILFVDVWVNRSGIGLNEWVLNYEAPRDQDNTVLPQLSRTQVAN